MPEPLVDRAILPADGQILLLAIEQSIARPSERRRVEFGADLHAARENSELSIIGVKLRLTSRVNRASVDKLGAFVDRRSDVLVLSVEDRPERAVRTAVVGRHACVEVERRDARHREHLRTDDARSVDQKEIWTCLFDHGTSAQRVDPIHVSNEIWISKVSGTPAENSEEVTLPMVGIAEQQRCDPQQQSRNELSGAVSLIEKLQALDSRLWPTSIDDDRADLEFLEDAVRYVAMLRVQGPLDFGRHRHHRADCRRGGFLAIGSE